MRLATTDTELQWVLALPFTLLSYYHRLEGQSCDDRPARIIQRNHRIRSVNGTSLVAAVGNQQARDALSSDDGSLLKDTINTTFVAALGDIPELWVSVSQRSLLLLAQAVKSVVPFATSTRSVLADAVYDAECGEHNDTDLRHEVDGVADRVARCVRKEICPSKQIMSVYQEFLSVEDVITHVAMMAPMLPMLTMNPPLTARTAGPAALLRPQERKPGPPGKAPAALKNTAMYFRSALLLTLKIVKPITQSSGKVAK